jgi:methionyl-tRNA formyltransferase
VLDDELCVATGNGRVRILELKPAGKRLMAFKDFANGYRLTAGDRFLLQWSK